MWLISYFCRINPSGINNRLEDRSKADNYLAVTKLQGVSEVEWPQKTQTGILRGIPESKSGF